MESHTVNLLWLVAGAGVSLLLAGALACWICHESAERRDRVETTAPAQPATREGGQVRDPDDRSA